MRSINRCGWLVIVALLWTTASVSAETYYVAQRAAEAADDNPGTEERPWKTLTKAVQTAQAGDVVWIKVGTYVEALTMENSGTNDKPIRFRAFGDDPVFITSPKVKIKGWKKVAGTTKVYEAKCPVSGKRTYGPPSPILAVDGKSIPGRGGQWALGLRSLKEVTDETVNRFVLTDEGNLRLNIGGDDPNDHDVEAIPRNFTAVRLKGSYLIVRGLQMVDVNAGVIDSGKHNIVEDCVVRGAWNDFVWDLPFVHDNAYAGTFRRCTVIKGFRGGFTTGSPRCLLKAGEGQMMVDAIVIWNNNNAGSLNDFQLFADNDADFGNGTGSQLGGTFLAATQTDPNPVQEEKNKCFV